MVRSYRLELLLIILIITVGVITFIFARYPKIDDLIRSKYLVLTNPIIPREEIEAGRTSIFYPNEGSYRTPDGRKFNIIDPTLITVENTNGTVDHRYFGKIRSIDATKRELDIEKQGVSRKIYIPKKVIAEIINQPGQLNAAIAKKLFKQTLPRASVSFSIESLQIGQEITFAPDRNPPLLTIHIAQ